MIYNKLLTSQMKLSLCAVYWQSPGEPGRQQSRLAATSGRGAQAPERWLLEL